MEVYSIPVENNPHKFIIYRPLAGLAFVGNRAMAELAERLAKASPEAWPGLLHGRDDIAEFLRAVGFLQPDPPEPVSNTEEFHPATAVLLLTNRCTLRCVYCYASAGDYPQQDLTYELGRAAIDAVCANAQERGLTRFEVSYHGGGEPTAAWKVLEACTVYARQKPLPAHIALTSNGLWSAKQCDWVIQNVDGLSFSLDGSPTTQDAMRPLPNGRGSSARVMRSIARLDEQGFKYGIRMTATPPFDHMVDDIRYLVEHTNAHTIQVEPAFNTRRGGHGRYIEEQAPLFVQAFLQAYEIARAAGCTLYYSGARLGLVTTTFCTAPYGALIVNAQAELVTCYEIADHNHPLMGISIIGKMQDGRPLPDLAARDHLHQLMAERRAGCRDCFSYWSCAGDCYTRSFKDQPGGHLIHTARCNINRSILQGLLLHFISAGDGVWRDTRRMFTQSFPGEAGAARG